MRVKKRIFSGAICEQLIYTIPDGAELKKAQPRLRFRNEEERLAHKLGISRRRFTRMINATFSPTSYYCTMTFDNLHEVHTFCEARRIRRIYYRRLRRLNPDVRLVIVMGRGKNTHRIHMHMLADGLEAEQIREKWTFGRVDHCEHLRANNYYGIGANKKDCGRDYSGLANYLFDHWSAEQGGHRYMATQNCSRGDEETPVEIKRNYGAGHPPRPPKGYKLIESICTVYGFYYFKYILISTLKHKPLQQNVNREYPQRDFDAFGADGMPSKKSLVNV